MPNHPERERLEAGASALGIALDPQQLNALICYLDLLERWNAVYNLTAIRSREEMLILHLLDSLAIVPHVVRLGAARILDVGAGAGLPGIPLAIALPEVRVTLVDSVGKKVAFMNQAILQLKLQARAIHARVEALTDEEKYDCITSRAFSSLRKLLESAGRLLADGGTILAMKGGIPTGEIDDLPTGWRLDATIQLTVPGLNAQRSILLLSPQAFESPLHTGRSRV